MEEGGWGFGNWSMANAVLLLRSGETLDWRGLACQRFRHQGWRVNGPVLHHVLRRRPGEWFMCYVLLSYCGVVSWRMNSEMVSNFLRRGKAHCGRRHCRRETIRAGMLDVIALLATLLQKYSEPDGR